ncbi:phosphotransferase [Streptomyces sp. NPDC048641]|uniref:phosphotransferase n=1 Tax=Streptomyces sp. NPDC048641 TaxID=3154825 RepID=UPI00341C54BD
MTGRAGDHDVKVAPKPILYTRETGAYRVAVPHLGHGNAPVRRDSSAELLALILTAVDGEPLKEEGSRARRRTAHRQAGRLLRRFHDAMTGSLVQPEADRVVENTVAGLDMHLAEAGDHLSATEADLLRHLVSALPGCGPLPAGWRHGEFWERNLVWNGRRCALIGFERSEPGPLVADFVKLATSLWPDHPRTTKHPVRGARPASVRDRGVRAGSVSSSRRRQRSRPRPPARRPARHGTRPAHRRTPAAEGPPVSAAPHLLIADVAQVLLGANGAALCVRRKPDAALAPGQLTVVGGHLEAGEPLDRAARREAKEETGVRISADQQEFYGLTHHREPGDGLDRTTAVFVAQSWEGEPHNAEPDKHEGLFWVPMEKPAPDCHPYTATVFHMLTHGPSYRALNWPSQRGSE